MGCTETREHKTAESKYIQTEEDSTNPSTFSSFASTSDNSRDTQSTADIQTSPSIFEDEFLTLKLEKRSLEDNILALTEKTKLYEAKCQFLEQSFLSLAQEVEKLKALQVLSEKENKIQKEKIFELNEIMKNRTDEYNELLTNAYNSSESDKKIIEGLKKKNLELERNSKVSNWTMTKCLQNEVEQANRPEKPRYSRGFKAGSYSVGSKEELGSWKNKKSIEETSDPRNEKI